MLDLFGFQLPVQVRFGPGVISELPSLLHGLDVSSVLVVSEEPIAAIDAVQATLAACRASGITVQVHLKPIGEPTVPQADDAAAALRGSGANGIVGIGGGASIDLARAARAIVGHRMTCAQLTAGGIEYHAPHIPLVAVPTTSGTGAEVTGAFVVMDGERKLGVANAKMRAQVALVDPTLTVGLPPGGTAASGIDALAQNIGGVIASNSHALSIAIGLEGVRHVAQGLKRAVGNGADLEARTHMALASLFGGLAINLADCTADHALGHAVGGVYHLPHGLAVGVVLAETLEINRHACAEALDRVGDALGVEGGLSDGRRGIIGVRRMLKAVGLPTASEAGVRESDLDRLVPMALADYCLTVNPHVWDEGDVRSAYAAAIALESR